MYDRKSLTYCKTKSIISIGYEGGAYEWQKMGRPKAESPKQKLVSVRLTKEEHEKLSEYAQQRNLTLTQAVKRGIESLYNTVS